MLRLRLTYPCFWLKTPGFKLKTMPMVSDLRKPPLRRHQRGVRCTIASSPGINLQPPLLASEASSLKFLGQSELCQSSVTTISQL
jgi:hypothetical protein